METGARSPGGVGPIRCEGACIDIDMEMMPKDGYACSFQRVSMYLTISNEITFFQLENYRFYSQYLTEG